MVAIAGWVVALAVLALGFYAVHRIPPGSFRLRTGLLRGLFEFSMEIESADAARKETSDTAEKRKHQTLTEGADAGLPVREALPKN